MRWPYAIAALNLTLAAAGAILAVDISLTGAVALAMVVAFSGTGALVAVRQPRNAIGWLFLGVGAGAALAGLAPALADRGVAEPGPPSTATEVLATYATSSWIPMMLPVLTFVLLLFPDGHLVGRRWRFVAWCAGTGIVVAIAAAVFNPGTLEDYPQIDNPLGTSGMEWLGGLAALLLLVAIVGSPASLVVRFRRAGRVQREQIKWLGAAGAFAALSFVVGFAAPASAAGIVFPVMMLSVCAIPVAAAMAILRYRLYDIDVVINRALVYTALTGTLAATYLALVLLLQLALSPLTEQSDLAIAVSTLAVAALFQPARRPIQSAVDRRFYRHRYDAVRTLEQFGTRLRDEIDLDSLAAELRGVAAETMQPAHVSLWLRRT